MITGYEVILGPLGDTPGTRAWRTKRRLPSGSGATIPEAFRLLYPRMEPGRWLQRNRSIPLELGANTPHM